MLKEGLKKAQKQFKKSLKNFKISCQKHLTNRKFYDKMTMMKGEVRQKNPQFSVTKIV